MKSCMQLALAIGIGLFAVIGLIVVLVVVLLPTPNPTAQSIYESTPAFASSPPAAVLVAVTATPSDALPTETPIPTETPHPISTRSLQTPIATTPTTANAVPSTVPGVDDAQPATTPDIPPIIQTYIPSVQLAPTPTEIELFRYGLASWMLEMQQWAKDFEALAGSGLETTPPEWIAAIDNLDRRLQQHTSSLEAMIAPYGYINAKEILVTGMEACGYAVRFFKEGEYSYSRLYIATCTLAFEMATTKMVFAPAK